MISVYIAGPMTGLPDFNFPAFQKAADFLRASGFAVVSPHELHGHTHESWEFYMKSAIQAMMNCEVIYLLHNWSSSRGAQLELILAQTLGYGVMYEADMQAPATPTTRKPL